MKQKLLNAFYSKQFAFGFSAIMASIMGYSICKMGYHQGRMSMLEEYGDILNKAWRDGS